LSLGMSSNLTNILTPCFHYQCNQDFLPTFGTERRLDTFLSSTLNKLEMSVIIMLVDTTESYVECQGMINKISHMIMHPILKGIVPTTYLYGTESLLNPLLHLSMRKNWHTIDVTLH